MENPISATPDVERADIAGRRTGRRWMAVQLIPQRALEMKTTHDGPLVTYMT
jgi:hypothetical protein